MKVAGEEGDVSQETLSSWDERSRELMRGYESRNVWNIDETGQFWRALPDKSLSERRKTLSWWQKLKKKGNLGLFSQCARRERSPYCCWKES